MKSIQKNFYLHPERDRDILTFLEDMSNMTRGVFIREAIREKINGRCESFPRLNVPVNQINQNTSDTFELGEDDI